MSKHRLQVSTPEYSRTDLEQSLLHYDFDPESSLTHAQKTELSLWAHAVVWAKHYRRVEDITRVHEISVYREYERQELLKFDKLVKEIS